jgi:hypothetical protein
LKGNAPSELGRLGNLKAVDLSYNEVGGQIPTEYRTLPELTDLNLISTVIFGDLNPIFCNRDELPMVSQLESLVADCLVPELTCSCCTVCCDNAGSETDKTCLYQEP